MEIRKKWDMAANWLASLGVDKWMHMVMTLVTALVASEWLLLLGMDGRVTRGLTGACLGMAAGAMKEAWDKRSGEAVSLGDLVADAVGALLFVAAYCL